MTSSIPPQSREMLVRSGLGAVTSAAPSQLVMRVQQVAMAAGGAAASDEYVMMPRAEVSRLNSELARVTAELAELRAILDGGKPAGDAATSWEPDKVEEAFDAVDVNGDGVLTLDEFRRGYALLSGDSVAHAFEVMDVDGNGTLDKDEFRRGFALLSSDSARAEAERRKVEEAVAIERVRAVQEAARNLAEAQLMDALFSDEPGKSHWPSGYAPVPGRAPLPRRKKPNAKGTSRKPK